MCECEKYMYNPQYEKYTLHENTYISKHISILSDYIYKMRACIQNYNG